MNTIGGTDTVFGVRYTDLIVRERCGVGISLKYQKDLVLFTQYYWESVKGYGRYLKDVDFYDLSADEREEITYKAFLMWRNYNVETGKMVK